MKGNMVNQKYIINEQIKDSKIVVVDENKQNLGVMPTSQALELAYERDLDLVLFVPSSKTGNLSICRIIDFGKFSFQQSIKQKQSRKNQTIIKVKEVKIQPQISIHDLEWKTKQVIGWLKQGYNIHLKIMTFGRIGTKEDLIQETYQKFLDFIKDYGKPVDKLKKVSPIMYEISITKIKE